MPIKDRPRLPFRMGSPPLQLWWEQTRAPVLVVRATGDEYLHDTQGVRGDPNLSLMKIQCRVCSYEQTVSKGGTVPRECPRCGVSVVDVLPQYHFIVYPVNETMTGDDQETYFLEKPDPFKE